MIDNSMGLAKIKASGVDLTELKSFYLPYSKEDGSINRVILGDFYMALPIPLKIRSLPKRSWNSISMISIPTMSRSFPAKAPCPLRRRKRTTLWLMPMKKAKQSIW